MKISLKWTLKYNKLGSKWPSCPKKRFFLSFTHVTFVPSDVSNIFQPTLLYKAIEGISFKDFAKIKSYYLNCLDLRTGISKGTPHSDCVQKFFNSVFISRIETFWKCPRNFLENLRGIDQLIPNHHVKIYIY